MQILSTLGINWQLLIAQFVNFLILVGILSYFVYKPVLKILDERRDRIRKSMDDAEHIEQQRKDIEQFKVDQLRKIDHETSVFLDNARVQAEKVKKEILERAQLDADDILVKAREQIADERRKLVSQVQASVAKLTVVLAEKILQREFTQSDQKHMMQVLEQEIPKLLK